MYSFRKGSLARGNFHSSSKLSDSMKISLAMYEVYSFSLTNTIRSKLNLLWFDWRNPPHSNSLVKNMLFSSCFPCNVIVHYCFLSLHYSQSGINSPGRVFLNSVHSFISSSRLLIGLVSNVVINNSVHSTKRENSGFNLKLFEDPELVSTIDSFILFSIS